MPIAVSNLMLGSGFLSPQPDFRIPERISPGFDDFPDLELEAVYAAGPDIGAGTIQRVRNIDIAPTILRILGVQPAPTVEGDPVNLGRA
ncbi:MAG: hypothetical protein ACRC32_03670 [Chroococcidiopsis sp.]